MQVRWSDTAVDDVEQIFHSIRRFNPAAVRRVAQSLLEAGEALARFPNRGRLGSEAGTRELTFIWPYVIVYELDDDAVRVLRVWHGARDRS